MFINQFIHFKLQLYLGQDHGRSKAYARNTGCKARINPGWDGKAPCAHIHTYRLIHTDGQFKVSWPISMFWEIGRNQKTLRKLMQTLREQAQNFILTVTLTLTDQTLKLCGSNTVNGITESIKQCLQKNEVSLKATELYYFFSLCKYTNCLVNLSLTCSCG